MKDRNRKKGIFRCARPSQGAVKATPPTQPSSSNVGAVVSPCLSPALHPIPPFLVTAPQSRPLFQNVHSNSAGSTSALPLGLDRTPRTSQLPASSHGPWPLIQGQHDDPPRPLRDNSRIFLIETNRGRGKLSCRWVCYISGMSSAWSCKGPPPRGCLAGDESSTEES